MPACPTQPAGWSEKHGRDGRPPRPRETEAQRALGESLRHVPAGARVHLRTNVLGRKRSAAGMPSTSSPLGQAAKLWVHQLVWRQLLPGRLMLGQLPR